MPNKYFVVIMINIDNGAFRVIRSGLTETKANELSQYYNDIEPEDTPFVFHSLHQREAFLK